MAGVSPAQVLTTAVKPARQRWVLAGAGALSSRAVNQKVLPRPGVLSTPMVPPIISTRCLESASPIPLPPNARLGVLSDARGLYPRLTARENIVYYGRLHGLARAQAEARATLLAGMLDMAPLMDRRTDGFSQGERMKTALARALVHDPSHIILDEPTNGLDVLATRSLRDALRRLRDDGGKCIVFSSHIMQEVERLCDRVVVVAGGRTVAQGTVPALLADTGQTDFEACFVQLAFGAPAAVAP